MSLLSRLALAPTPPFKRPQDLLYASTELPPAVPLIGLAFQHAATALALIAYVLASAKIGGLDAEATRGMVTATILGMAIATFLQSWGGRFGSGTLLVNIPDPLLVVISGTVAAQYGLGGLVLVGVVNGAVALGAGYVVPRLRAVLPPSVAGVVVCVAGISLVSPALTHMADMDGAGAISAYDLLIGIATLGIIAGLSIWGSQRMKLFALLVGLAVGVVLAAMLGELEGVEQLAHTPVFGLPRLPAPALNVDPGLLIAVGLLALMTQLDCFGCVVLMHKMNDADWRRPDMDMVGGGIRANGLGNLLAAWFGAYPGATSSANIALAHISRSTSRWIGLAAGALLALTAFLPQVTLALTLTPISVIGAVEVYAAAYLIVSGIELIASRAMDSRGIFMVGLAFIAGLGVMFLPGLAKLAPESLRFLAENGVIVAGLTAILLNLLFRLGTSRRARLTVSPQKTHAQTAQDIVGFVETQGAAWNARRDTVRRAALAALEAAEALQAGSERRIQEVHGSFDEFNLDIEFVYSGPPLVLQAKPATGAHALLDIDDHAFEAALDQALSGVSHVLLRHMADRLLSGKRGENSYLRLHFDH